MLQWAEGARAMLCALSSSCKAIKPTTTNSAGVERIPARQTPGKMGSDRHRAPRCPHSISKALWPGKWVPWVSHPLQPPSLDRARAPGNPRYAGEGAGMGSDASSRVGHPVRAPPLPWFYHSAALKLL